MASFPIPCSAFGDPRIGMVKVGDWRQGGDPTGQAKARQTHQFPDVP